MVRKILNLCTFYECYQYCSPCTREFLIFQMHKIVEDGAKPENLKEFVVEKKKGGVCQRTDIHNEPKLKNSI